MRAIVIVFIWLVVTFALFGSKASGPPGDDVGGASSLLVAQHITLKAGAEVLARGCLRLQVVDQATALEGVRTGFMSAQLDLENDDQRMGWYMDGIDLVAGRSTWSGETHPDNFSLFSRPCEVNMQLTRKSHNVQAGALVSPDCAFEVKFEAKDVDLEQVGRKAVHWSVLLNVCTMMEIRGFLSQIANARPLQVSLATVGAIAIFGLMEAIFLVGLGLMYSFEFNTFSIVSLFKFILFTLLQITYLAQLWRTRFTTDNEEEVDRRRMSVVYVRFYAILTVCIMLVYHFWDSLPVMLIVGQLFFLPQIGYDAWHGHKNSISPGFLCLVSLSKLLPALYLYGCPRTIFTGDPLPLLPWNDAGTGNVAVALLLVAASGSVLALAMSQRMLGPRWFAPAWCLPHVYNYVRQVEIKDGQVLECVICMCDIDISVRSQLSVTPCDHIFHRKCLEQWMDIKMECPTCRQNLPPLV